MSKATTIPIHVCKCGNKVDSTRAAFEDKLAPEKNDLSLCAYCGRVWAFNEDLTQREVTLLELAAYPEETQLQIKKAQDILRLLR